MCKDKLALNNLKCLICHKTQPKHTYMCVCVCVKMIWH